MVLTTSAGGGSRFMLMAFSIAPRTWGFKIAHSLGVVMHESPDWGTPEEMEKLEKTKTKKISTAAKKFYGSLMEGRPNLSVFNMAQFLYTRDAYKKSKVEPIDYNYWKDHGWFEKSAYYYYDPKANVVKKILANVLSKFVGIIGI